MRLFPLEIVPIVCAHCGEPTGDDADNIVNEDGSCTSCYVNTDCPAECNTPHDAPSFRQQFGSEWACPETGDVFYYEGPNRLEDRGRGSWGVYETVLVRDAARRLLWMDVDDTNWCESCDTHVHPSRYAYDDLCRTCYDERDHYDCDCDECSGTMEVGPPVAVRCSRSCISTATHYHPITEDVTCGRHATHSHELIPELIAA